MQIIKKPLALLAICVALITNSEAQISFLENPPAMSNGSYLSQQSLYFDGATITWAAGNPPAAGFFVQAFSMFGSINLAFGEWNGSPYLVTSDPIVFGSSVKSADPFQGQRQTSGPAISSQYFGVIYDAGGGNVHYGWINLSTVESFEAGIINAVAFNTIANADILAGQTAAVPEPKEAAGLIAIAAIAAILYRRRKFAFGG